MQRNTFIACFLGWSLDAFDFFILVFCVSALATQFHAKVSDDCRGEFSGRWRCVRVGAFLFGMMADRFGRRPTLMVDIIAYSVFELASAFAPSLKIFLITRALFGIAMGGEWGVGAALAFETLPAEGRGFFSGLLQEGYVVGYLIAALVYGTLFPFIGWRGMFVIGALPALLVIYIRTKVDESPAWMQGRVVARRGEPTGQRYLVTCWEFCLPGRADVRFQFLQSRHAGSVSDISAEESCSSRRKTVSLIAIVYNLGALLGGVLFGTLSERIGRRRAIVIAALLSIPVIPLWAYSQTLPMLALGGFLMQFMVQGAWGVIPAHLNELSPPAVRGTLPGFAYQLGNFLASRNAVIQAQLAESALWRQFSRRCWLGQC